MGKWSSDLLIPAGLRQSLVVLRASVREHFPESESSEIVKAIDEFLELSGYDRLDRIVRLLDLETP